MKNIKIRAFIFPVIIFAILCFMACDTKDDSVPMTNQTSKIAVRLTDAPGDYDKVNLEVIDVLIKSNENSDDNGWVSIGANKPVLYNVLNLTGGINALIADTWVPSGYLGQIRLLLGENNTVVVNGVTHPLKTPSAQQSGLKLKVNQTLEPGIFYDFTLDFDVDKSIVKAGNSGIYNLHPVIRVSTIATSGVIKGSVTPTEIAVSASVVVAGVPVSTNVNTTTGVFQLNGIPAGTYTVTLTPDPTSGYLEATVPNIVVTNGVITDMGNVVLAMNK
jgi:hypothetical protein